MQHCTLDYGSYTKDLSAITQDLSSIFILDNSPGAYRSYPGKGQQMAEGIWDSEVPFMPDKLRMAGN